MIDQLKFEIYCKPASLFRREYSELLQGFDSFESTTDANLSISLLNKSISQWYHRHTFLSEMHYESSYDKKNYKQFQGRKNVIQHYKKILEFLEKKALTFNVPLRDINQICFSIALNKSQINLEELLDIFMQKKLVDLSLIMKQLSIVDDPAPSTNVELFITTGDLCFIFSKTLQEWHTRNTNNVTKPYCTCSHTGDIRIIYKTLLCMESHQRFLLESERKKQIDNLPDSFFKVQSYYNQEFLLLTKLGLLSQLYAYSKQVKYKFQCDDDYLLMNSDCHLTRRLPFFCVPTMPASCNFKQLIAMLLSTYKQFKTNKTSETVLLQTYSLVYPAIKPLINTKLFREYFDDLIKLFELEIDRGDFVNEMDLNCYEPIDFIEIKPPEKDLMNTYKAAEQEYLYIKGLEDYLIENGVVITRKYKF